MSPQALPSSRIFRGAVEAGALHRGATKAWRVDEEEPAWSPADVAGLAFWVDAAQDVYADGAEVVSYIEHSAAGRALNQTQVGGPVFRAGGGKPYIDTNVGGGLRSAEGFNLGTAGLTFLFAARIEGGSFPMMLVHGPDSDGFEMRHDGSAQQIVTRYATYSTYWSHPTSSGGGVDHLWALRIDAASLHKADSWTNASLDTRAWGGTMHNTPQYQYVARREGGYQFMGRVYEALVYAGAVSDDDYALLAAYLKDKWGLP